MFRKFRKLVVPFMLASLSPLLVNSPARADTSYWTGWQKCTFSVIKNQYTPWRARIAVRSDGAARPVQVEFGPSYQNDEPIYRLKASDSWVVAGGTRRYSPYNHTVSFSPPTRGYASQTFSNLTWISKSLPRYASIVLYHSNLNDVCTSEIPFPPK